jgi:hypothetical protein
MQRRSLFDVTSFDPDADQFRSPEDYGLIMESQRMEKTRSSSGRARLEMREDFFALAKTVVSVVALVGFVNDSPLAKIPNAA